MREMILVSAGSAGTSSMWAGRAPWVGCRVALKVLPEEKSPSSQRTISPSTIFIASRRPLASLTTRRRACSDIGIDRHLTAKRVDLPNDLALDLPDGRIATHLGDGVDVAREEQGRGPGARRSERRFHTRVSSAAHDHVISFIIDIQLLMQRSGPGPRRITPAEAEPDPSLPNTERSEQLIEHPLVVHLAGDLAKGIQGFPKPQNPKTPKPLVKEWLEDIWNISE